MSAPKQRDPMIITHVGGVQFAAQVRSHRVLVDQPLRGGGADAGPSPIELLGVSLGTCVALYVQQFCQSRGLPYDGMRVELQQRRVRGKGRASRRHSSGARGDARARGAQLPGAQHAGARRRGGHGVRSGHADECGKSCLTPPRPGT